MSVVCRAVMRSFVGVDGTIPKNASPCLRCTRLPLGQSLRGQQCMTRTAHGARDAKKKKKVTCAGARAGNENVLEINSGNISNLGLRPVRPHEWASLHGTCRGSGRTLQRPHRVGVLHDAVLGPHWTLLPLPLVEECLQRAGVGHVDPCRGTCWNTQPDSGRGRHLGGRVSTSHQRGGKHHTLQS